MKKTIYGAIFTFAMVLPFRVYSVEPIKVLVDGNHRFVNGTVNHPHQIAAATKHLTIKQNPHTAIISCSDSRVTPEIIFDQGLGDLFDIRIAGNVVSPDVVGSLEYAVEHLGVKNILIMGHESCGAVHAAIDLKNDPKHHQNDPTHVGGLIRKIDIGPEAKTKTAHDVHYRIQAIHNIKHSIHEVLRNSQVVRSKYLSGKLSVQGAIYSLNTGKVDFFKLEHSLEKESVL